MILMRLITLCCHLPKFISKSESKQMFCEEHCVDYPKERCSYAHLASLCQPTDARNPELHAWSMGANVVISNRLSNECCRWALGLSRAAAAEWLVDCYRMRVDDDVFWAPVYLHGLAAPDTSPAIVVNDFLVFAKLAVRHRYVYMS